MTVSSDYIYIPRNGIDEYVLALKCDTEHLTIVILTLNLKGPSKILSNPFLTRTNSLLYWAAVPTVAAFPFPPSAFQSVQTYL